MALPVFIQSNTPYAPDLADVLRIFLGEVEQVPEDQAALTLRHHHEQLGDTWQETCTLHRQGEAEREVLSAPVAKGILAEKRETKRALKRCCYGLMKRVCGQKPLWGSLTGIRPTRLLYEALKQTGDLAQAKQRLMTLYDVDAEKADLLEEILLAQQGLMEEDPKAVDIYLSIPFCKTRCAYCSFVAEAMGKGERIPAYLEAIAQEIDAAHAIVRAHDLTVRALYVGGGTPTALNPHDLAGILRHLTNVFPEAQEFTVEAGRPDTLEEEMLRVLRDFPVTRISINPQTMCDETLRRIGRAHDAAAVERAMALARRLGFADINMDLICALPGETEADFARTLEKVQAMAPESLTVHTLAIKRASRLRYEAYESATAEEAARMVAMGREAAHQMGLSAYYLYRQKYMAGNLENVGYAKPGRACRYNIDMMEETTSILALGAGAISKRIFSRTLRIERAPNVSNIDHYLARTQEMIERKQALWAHHT